MHVYKMLDFRSLLKNLTISDYTDFIICAIKAVDDFFNSLSGIEVLCANIILNLYYIKLQRTLRI